MLCGQNSDDEVSSAETPIQRRQRDVESKVSLRSRLTQISELRLSRRQHKSMQCFHTIPNKVKALLRFYPVLPLQLIPDVLSLLALNRFSN